MLRDLFLLPELVSELESESKALCCVFSFQNDRNSEMPAKLFIVICKMSLHEKTRQTVIINLVQQTVNLRVQHTWTT